jgi:Na+-transporting NADH:ubiquinone oxidoreductase subunit NqrC
MPRHRFAAFWATTLVILGLLLVVGGALLAGAAVTLDMPWGSLTGQAVLERVLAAVVLAISGVLAGAPFIALGEMMRLFIAQRRILERQRRLLRRIARQMDDAVGQPEVGTAAADRLLQRRRP